MDVQGKVGLDFAVVIAFCKASARESCHLV